MSTTRNIMNSLNESAPPKNYSDMTPLERHIAYFSGQDGVGYDSTHNKLLEMHEAANKARLTANIVSFVGGIKTHSCPYAKFQPREAVGVLNHPRDTGIYNADGTLNESRWEKLTTYSEEDNGIKIITANQFYQFLNWCRSNDARWDFFGLGKIASDGEWHDFFELCTDHWKKTETGLEPAVKLETLRKFFENTPEVFDKVVEHQLPVSKPL